MLTDAQRKNCCFFTQTPELMYSYIHLPRIHPLLYLGDRRGAHQRLWGGVLCTAGCHPRGASPTVRYEFHDTEDESVQNYWQATMHLKNGAMLLHQLLQKGEKENKDVFVHCVAGINRSASTIVAYAVHRGWDVNEAIAYVRERNAERRSVPADRPSAVSNRVFERILRQSR